MAKKDKCSCSSNLWMAWIALILIVLEMFYPVSFNYGTFTITSLSLAVLLLSIVAICTAKNCLCSR